MGDIDFEEQLEQERLAREQEEARRLDSHPQTRTEPDGTVYEWDVDKKAWFPKIDIDFIAKYQMNYGVQDEETKASGDTAESTNSTDQENYYKYIQSYYEAGQERVMGKKKKEELKEDTHDEMVEKLEQLESSIQQGEGPAGGDSDSGEGLTYSKETMEKYTEEEKKQYNEYWSYYYGTEYHDYYADCMSQYTATEEQRAGSEGQSEGGQGQKDAGEGQKEEGEGQDKKKGKKRKAAAQQQRPEGWFEVEEVHNTNVYVSDLPLDITEDEFKELMNKCGLIMYDPRTKKPKLKLYLDENGQPKGDGRCCYIKKESVDLALNILDGSDVRGHKIKVERASFNMKGDYDPSKKKKKLTNKEKRKFKEKQAKLFDWRPERPQGTRPKHEKVVILKNLFDPTAFELNPALINTVREDVRSECSNYGDIKKVVVYDRHPDGVVSVAYKEAEEADLCVTSLHQRWFAKRRILASTWDGKTKYEVEETEQQREERLKKWENFLETGVKPADEKSKDSAADSKVAESSDKASDVSKHTVEAKSSNEMENSRVTVNTGSDDKSSDGAETTDNADGSSDVTLSKSSAEDSSMVIDSADGKSDVTIATSTDSADGSSDMIVNTNSGDKSFEGTEMTESAEYSSVSANSADEKKDVSTSVSGEG